MMNAIQVKIMNAIQIMGLTYIGLAILIVGLSIPLIRRRVPMNAVYGARFKACFKSDENWYAINEYGGRVLMKAAVPIAGYGVLGAFFHQQLSYWYLEVSTLVVIGPLLLAAWISYRKAREIDNKGASKSA